VKFGKNFNCYKIKNNVTKQPRSFKPSPNGGSFIRGAAFMPVQRGITISG
jgi:hypothetical protein